ncbi:replication protein A 70 kDa DNA-binding subunit B [Striga asiatica]|uniref:Replication protein A subunit n=1 Tax=Striga asiatica TaxID=4170 RepID=A0A5A7Q0Q5_STRAF|nr:replication protein A 70 kDa DNA-binding subunit B [Striga asiatica]
MANKFPPNSNELLKFPPKSRPRIFTLYKNPPISHSPIISFFTINDKHRIGRWNMSKTVSPDAVSIILANPCPDSSSNLPEIVVQVVDLKPTGTKYMFMANDGKMKVRALLQSFLSSQVTSGSIQNLGLIRVLDYTLSDIPTKNEKFLIVSKCEVVSPALEVEYKADSGLVSSPEQNNVVKSEANGNSVVKSEANGNSVVKSEANGVMLKPKEEVMAKSAAQIVHEQHGNMAPSGRMSMTRRIYPLVSLNPYQGNWTIKVWVTSKGNMRSYKNARGEGCVFNVELTDEDVGQSLDFECQNFIKVSYSLWCQGTQIQATMFNEAARKFFDKFQMGKVYYISKGTLKVANKQYRTVQNDYEMTLNENSVVEEIETERTFIPETKFNFVPIDELGPYINGRELVDVIGVVQSVSPTMSIRRKSNNETVPKRDITIADETKKTVVVSLWGDHATNVGQELLDMSDKSPVVAIKSLKVGDFQGVSLSAVSKSIVVVNPETPEAKKLRSWYDSEGKDTNLASVGDGLSPSAKGGARSMYSDRVSLAHITSNPSLGEDKPVFFCIKAYISYIKQDQAMWYRACKTCNKKVTEAVGSGYWCEGCQKNEDDCSLRYVMVVRVSDASGEAYLSVFNEQAEKIIGCSADELNEMRTQDGDSSYQMKLKDAMWVPHLFRVSVTPHEYNNEKKQRITIRAVAPVDYAAESKYLLEEIAKLKVSK